MRSLGAFLVFVGSVAVGAVLASLTGGNPLSWATGTVPPMLGALYAFNADYGD